MVDGLSQHSENHRTMESGLEESQCFIQLSRENSKKDSLY